MKKAVSLLAAVFCTLIPLAADEFFSWNAEENGEKLTLVLTVAPGGRVYADQVTFQLSGAGGTSLRLLSAPEREKYAEEGGAVDVYGKGMHKWVFAGEPPFRVTAGWQGCTDSTCFSPQEKQLLPRMESPLQKQETAADLAVLRGTKIEKSASGMMSAGEFLHFLQGAGPREEPSPFHNIGTGMLLLLVLLGGLGLNLTPCVLPMIPINLAIIGARESRRAGFRRGLAYGCGMALAYGVLGVVVVLTGGRFGELNSSSVFNFIIAVVFFLLAAAMAGWIRVDLSGWRRFRPGSLPHARALGAFLLGGTAALLAGACVAPVVIGVLLFSAERYQQGNAFALLLPLVLGIGMALPWPLAGAGLGVLPKPGKFMVAVKYLFAGIIFLAGGWYLYLGILLLPGRYDAQREMMQLQEAIARGAAEGKPVLVEFSASWCKNCAAMERTTLRDPAVRKTLESFAVVKLHAERPGEEPMRSLLRACRIPGLPGFAVLIRFSE